MDGRMHGIIGILPTDSPTDRPNVLTDRRLDDMSYNIHYVK